MSAAQWARSHLGRSWAAPGGLGGQCVDLVNLYVSALGAPVVRRNAADWALPGALPSPWRWEPNGPVNSPPLGAVVVWRGGVPAVGIGPFGHIAVALVADSALLLSVDQGWPPGAVTALVWHSYAGVAGWWALPEMRP